MTPFLKTGRSVRRYLADRLDMLQQTLEHLGARLREGIATAIGETVSDAAKVAIRSFLAGLQAQEVTPEPPRYAPYPADEPSYYDGWDQSQYDPDVNADEPPPPPKRPTPWRMALTAAVQVLAFWLRSRTGGRLLTAFGLAAATGAAALVGGAAGATGVAVIGTALSMVTMTDSTRSWVDRLYRVAATR